MEPLTYGLIKELRKIFKKHGGLHLIEPSRGVALVNNLWIVEWPETCVDFDDEKTEDEIIRMGQATADAGVYPSTFDRMCWQDKLLPSHQFCLTGTLSENTPTYERVPMTELEEQFFSERFFDVATGEITQRDPVTVYSYMYERLYYRKEHTRAFGLIFPTKDYRVYVPDPNTKDSNIPYLCPFFEGYPVGAAVNVPTPYGLKERASEQEPDTSYGPGSSPGQEENQYEMAAAYG
jgi:hypothetical protein